MVDAQPAALRAYTRTKEAIVRGDFAGGASISEVVIAQALEISRTPVHEAFLRLATENSLTLESRKGAIVSPMSPTETVDVLEMREAVEAAAAARIIGDERTSEVVPRLRELLVLQAAAADTSATDEFVRLDDEFHMAVVEASRNAIPIQFMGTLRDRQQRLRHQLLRVSPRHLASGFEQHERLADALESLDAVGYRTVLAEHVASHRGAL